MFVFIDDCVCTSSFSHNLLLKIIDGLVHTLTLGVKFCLIDNCLVIPLSDPSAMISASSLLLLGEVNFSSIQTFTIEYLLAVLIYSVNCWVLRGGQLYSSTAS